MQSLYLESMPVLLGHMSVRKEVLECRELKKEMTAMEVPTCCYGCKTWRVQRGMKVYRLQVCEMMCSRRGVTRLNRE